MKKITILCSYFASVLFLTNSNSIAQNHVNSSTPIHNVDDIKKTTDLNTVDTKNYKKVADSILTVVENNNSQSAIELMKVKKLQTIREQQDKEIETVRKEIQTNLKTTLELLSQKLNDKKKETKLDSQTKNEIILGNDVYTIDSVYVKGSLFKKSKWVYEITFPDGTKRKLE